MLEKMVSRSLVRAISRKVAQVVHQGMCNRRECAGALLVLIFDDEWHSIDEFQSIFGG